MSALTTPTKYVVNHWRLFAMQDGYTLHSTVIYAKPVEGGFHPAFVGKEGTHIVISSAGALPNPLAARNYLRNLLQQAHDAGSISLEQHPLEVTAA